MSSVESVWFTGRRSPTARLRLFCIPYAGGGASLYREWASALAPWIEVQPVQLPGRESRFDEPPLTSMADLVQEILDPIGPYLDLPIAVFGHSMGALIGYELVRRLQRRQPVRYGQRTPGLQPPRPTPATTTAVASQDE